MADEPIRGTAGNAPAKWGPVEPPPACSAPPPSAGTNDLELRQAVAGPMLDWFFGRGPYATTKPGTQLTPLPASTPSAVTIAAIGQCP